MCGIVGFLNPSSLSLESRAPTLRAMTQALQHRGPDGRGIWLDAEKQVGFGHRRLSIIDLEHGVQPMTARSERYVLTFNGEIYNFRALRQRFKLETGDDRSDTATLLALIEAEGLDKTLERLNGMFALALWDKKTRRLHLARDRLGKKPLYWGLFGRQFIFGSEIKALMEYPGWDRRINRHALASYFQYSYVPAPYSIYEGVWKLKPGHLLSIGLNGKPDIRPFWDFRAITQRKPVRPVSRTAIVRDLKALLSDAVRQRLVSDVPIGCLLSGGIDSSLIAGIMQSQTHDPIKTFSIGFTEKAFNEAGYAKAVATHLNTDHHELYLSESDVQNTVPQLAKIFDEPFSDSSQLPTLLVSQLARKSVTVVLSGDGGDEVFAGYNRYLWGAKLWQMLKWIPAPGRRIFAALLRQYSPAQWDTFAGHMPFLDHPQFGDKMHKIANMLGQDDRWGVYQSFLSQWTTDEHVVKNGYLVPNALNDPACTQHLRSFIRAMQYADTQHALPDDILAKVDRCSMACGLEVRSPLLDYRVVDLAWQIPISSHVSGPRGKTLLRELLRHYVPTRLVDRPKQGFGIPIHEWLRGPFRSQLNEYLGSADSEFNDLLDLSLIRRKWMAHLKGERNWGHALWGVFQFFEWHEHWHRQSSVSRQSHTQTHLEKEILE